MAEATTVPAPVTQSSGNAPFILNVKTGTDGADIGTSAAPDAPERLFLPYRMIEHPVDLCMQFIQREAHLHTGDQFRLIHLRGG